MRPPVLFPLFAESSSLKGVGPAVQKTLARLFGKPSVTVLDLVSHLPHGVIDRSYSPAILAAEQGRVATFSVHVERHILPPRYGRRPYKVICMNDSGFLALLFFHVKSDYLERLLPVGAARIVSGRIERQGGEISMSHPDYVLPPEKAKELPLIEPVYPMTQGITNKQLSNVIRAALQKLPALPEWIAPDMLQGKGWASWKESLLSLHRPQAQPSLDSPARKRLAYDELLASQLTLRLVRRHMVTLKTDPLKGDGKLLQAIVSALPFTLTNAQSHAWEEIRTDLERGERMLRLLQGDVGSGKTVVALLAMAKAIEAGKQAVLMAPTDLLCQQHFQTLAPWAEKVGISIGCLTSQMKKNDKSKLIEKIRLGDVQCVIGTHALFQEGVTFDNLGMVVIDEQHRFGVEQRLKLTDKGTHPHVLLMSATPIPRSLTMTLYGDLECSKIAEKPKGRKPIDTRVIPSNRLEEVVEGIGRVIARGEKAYWICPLVDESEKSDLAATEERFAYFSQLFPGKVGLAHGKMKPAQREEAMRAFASGETQMLVATTVVEVGVDVKDASVIVIEQAERFGLSQLHQLRGRVGRGEIPSSCVLLYDSKAGETAKKRLSIIRASEDGFEIAEEDLRLRGGGELLGTRQSGLPTMKFADPFRDHLLLAEAHQDAKHTVDNDPYFKTPRGDALKLLLHLFDHSEAMDYVRSG